MMLLEMILVPIFALFILFILTKLMGYRQISQLSMYDYINGMTIGSIAAELIMKGYEDFLRPTIGMSVCALVIVLLSILSNKSRRFRYIVEGKAITLYKNDTLYDKQLAKAKMDIDEFLMQCRISGYFDLSEIDTVVLETNGEISVLPKDKYRTITVDDMHLSTTNKATPYILVQEGVVFTENLKKVSKDIHWLERTLKVQGYKKEEILLLLCDIHGTTHCYLKNTIEENYI